MRPSAKPNSRLVLGIDPGATSGAYAVYDPSSGELLKVEDLPIRQQLNGLGEIDDLLLLSKLQYFAPRLKACALEKVGARPHDGRTSLFRFAENYGMIRGLLVGLHVAVIRIDPAVWKGIIGVRKDKRTSLAKAREFFPYDVSEFKRVKDHNKAEAALLAYFAGKRLM